PLGGDRTVPQFGVFTGRNRSSPYQRRGGGVVLLAGGNVVQTMQGGQLSWFEACGLPRDTHGSTQFGSAEGCFPRSARGTIRGDCALSYRLDPIAHVGSSWSYLSQAWPRTPPAPGPPLRGGEPRLPTPHLRGLI